MFKALFNAILSTIKGNDGKISSRKTTAFWFVVLATIQAISMIIMQWLIISKAVSMNDANTKAMVILYDFYVATLAMILLLFGIITIGNVQSFKIFARTEEKKDENGEG